MNRQDKNRLLCKYLEECGISKELKVVEEYEIITPRKGRLGKLPKEVSEISKNYLWVRFPKGKVISSTLWLFPDAPLVIDNYILFPENY